MDRQYYEAQWHFDVALRAWVMTKAGFYNPEVMLSPDDFQHVIQSEDVRALIRKLDDAGWIVPRLDQRLREEDLKITHRLLDIVHGLTDKRKPIIFKGE